MDKKAHSKLCQNQCGSCHCCKGSWEKDWYLLKGDVYDNNLKDRDDFSYNGSLERDYIFCFLVQSAPCYWEMLLINEFIFQKKKKKCRQSVIVVKF